MDAHAILKSQGWRGLGHSLHPTSDDKGLSRPLLVSKKQNTLGVGKPQHKTSDMWWMNAFDKSLKGLDTSEEGKVVQKISNSGLDMVVMGGSKYVGGGGLYSCFVRGEVMGGTLAPTDVGMLPQGATKQSDHTTVETREARRVRKAARRAQRASAVVRSTKSSL